MRSAFSILAVLSVATLVRAAERPSFPYETTVEFDNAQVRSGPGSKYYPTAILRRGERVVVHRHDPGAWYMIAPPPGSFSWINAKHVRKLADDRGVVLVNNAVVWVGSFESDIREVFQRRLSEGDDVRILGEKSFPAQAGAGSPELWFRISPPRGEWRWINGQTLAPAEGTTQIVDNPSTSTATPTKTTVRRLTAEDPSNSEEGDFVPPQDISQSRPYLEASQQRGDVSLHDGLADELGERPLVRRREARPTAASDARVAEGAPLGLESQLEELDRLDARFRSILDKEPLEWDFAQLAEDYRHLRDFAGSEALRQSLDTRARRIGQYEQVKAAHAESARLSQAVLQRDAQLAEEQKMHEARATALAPRRYDGAGIVQRSALDRAGAPRYALLAPNGRVLAYLVPAPGVNLEDWVGRSAGVIGPRVPDAALRADLITVVRLAPVRLSQ